ILIAITIDAGRLAMTAHTLNAAAREACRTAVIPGNTQSDVQTKLNSLLSSAGLTGVTVSQVPSDCTTARLSSTTNTVQITLSVQRHSIWWPTGSSKNFNVTVRGTATMSTERP